MTNLATTATMSAEEYLTWEEQQAEKHEFFQGEIFAMVGVTRKHATIAGNVFAFLKQQLRNTPCRVYMADMKLQLETENAFFYPDVLVTCSASDHQAERYLTQPRLIIEVLSESTEAYDRGGKFMLYRKFATLNEYVLIDPIKRNTEIFRKDPTGHWVLYEYAENDPVTFACLDLSIANPVLYENAD